MRQSEFHERLNAYFGSTYAYSVFLDHKLSTLPDLSPGQALEQGINPRIVWKALCRDFDITED